MIAKALLMALGSALCLYLWWTVPLKGLRAGGEDADRAEEAAKAAVDDADVELEMPVEEARAVLNQYKGMLEWVGDPITRSAKADFMAVCPMMKARLGAIVGKIDKYSCQVGVPKEGIEGARVLPLTLRVDTPAEDGELPAAEAERLILAVEEIPELLLQKFRAAEDPPNRTDAGGNPITPKAYIEMNVDFYVLAEPPSAAMEEAEEEEADRAAKFETDALDCTLVDLTTSHLPEEQRKQEMEDAGCS